MRFLSATLPSGPENLAADEAAMLAGHDTLRIWEPAKPMVVLGRSSRVAEEVDRAACEERGVGVFRRVSGGATIVTGPGCLMYAVTLPLAAGDNGGGDSGADAAPAVDTCHNLVLGPLAAALRTLVPSVHRAGTSDLAFRPSHESPAVKFSGNSLRVTRGRLLYHGTLLYDFDLSLISRLLRTPPRQPDYRAARPHAEFVANLPVGRGELTEAVASAWPIEETVTSLPDELATPVADLVATRYATDAWNFAR